LLLAVEVVAVQELLDIIYTPQDAEPVAAEAAGEL
jgi:hypothetical protein